MIQSILCLILLAAGSQYASANPVTGYQYNRDIDAWLKLHTEPAPWWDASVNCQREGGVLASPTNNALAQAMRSSLSDHKLTSNVFTGVLAKGDEALRKSLFNNVTYADSELNNVDSGEECVALTDAGAVTHVNCARAHPYFCRKEGGKCGPSGNGYEFDPRTGSCYKFHRISLSWRAALETCYDEGGHLAVINSAMESSVLRELYGKNPADVITGTQDPNYAIVGFRKYEDGEWATIYGEPLAEAGFLQWSSGEPNNNGGDEYCGSIHRDGLYNDLRCTYPFAFICEITP